MARSPLTLAASVTSALPHVDVVSVRELTENAAGRYDSAVATLDDGRDVVVRIPVDAEVDAELVSEVRALASLSAGVRAVLPFAAPTVLGTARVDGRTVVVEDLLPGYRVDAAHVPPGRGVATSVAEAIAAVHDLPPSVVRDAGLPVRTAAQVREDCERVLDRAEATERLPFGLLRRWSTALGADRLWRFETTVSLGGVDPSWFVLQDVDDVPKVTGLLSWHGLQVGDPAEDLRWTSVAVTARADVLAAYTAAARRAPDALIAQRARLHAELEFARWLVHGHAAGSDAVVADAVGLLEALDASVRDEPLLPADGVDVDDAIRLIGQVPETGAESADTSMQTDTYDAAALSAYLDDNETAAALETAPVDLSDWSGQESAPSGPRDEATGSEDPDVSESARNALRRWTAEA